MPNEEFKLSFAPQNIQKKSWMRSEQLQVFAAVSVCSNYKPFFVMLIFPQGKNKKWTKRCLTDWQLTNK